MFYTFYKKSLSTSYTFLFHSGSYSLKTITVILQKEMSLETGVLPAFPQLAFRGCQSCVWRDRETRWLDPVGQGHIWHEKGCRVNPGHGLGLVLNEETALIGSPSTIITVLLPILTCSCSPMSQLKVFPPPATCKSSAENASGRKWLQDFLHANHTVLLIFGPSRVLLMEAAMRTCQSSRIT